MASSADPRNSRYPTIKDGITQDWSIVDESIYDDELAAEADSMKSRDILQQEIQALIAPYRHDNNKPPFNAAQLIAMAIFSNDGLSCGMNAILKWIGLSFAFYGARMVEVYAETVNGYMCGARPGGMTLVIDGFERSLTLFEVPLEGDQSEMSEDEE